MKHSIRLSSLLVILVLSAFISLFAQDSNFPSTDGECVCYDMQIETNKGYISGVCFILKEGTVIKGSVVNEFGVTAIDFSYNEEKDKMQLHHVIDFLNKWYIKRTLKNDLKHVLSEMKCGGTQYVNKKRGLIYSFSINVNASK